MLESIESTVNAINAILFSNVTVFALLGTGVLYTIWSCVGQYYAFAHGVAVIRGKYDHKNDPGAINHFQALSAALSATVGLGNIGGVAVAVALGGPGAVFWMWIIGVVGMALKMTEVTQSMLTRNVKDPSNPHGGPMYVVAEGFKDWGIAWLGKVLASFFCVAVVIAAITGGNMFQAWNVAAVTNQYFPSIPRELVGIVLAVLTGVVILGGIRRIGSVAGRLVPFMCAIYLLAGIYVIILNIDQIPEILATIVRAGMGFEETSASGAFLGASLGTAFIWGVKRALFSSEAGWGSAPIAHAAARTDEPVREGIVAGLEPFIDTLVVCTVTALVILSSGAWNRGPEARFADPQQLKIAFDEPTQKWSLATPELPNRNEESQRINRIEKGTPGWSDGDSIFMLVGETDLETGQRGMLRVNGEVKQDNDGKFFAEWEDFEASYPSIRTHGVYVNYAGAALTAHAFDRVTPGLGLWLVLAASWLFALSTIISWSYYGEQGIYYVFGSTGRDTDHTLENTAVFVYRASYCLLAFVATLPFIKTDVELDMWTTLGMGCMLVCNIPFMLLFGYKAMNAYHDYIRRLKAGEFKAHAAQSFADVIEGKSIEEDQ